MRRLGVVEGFGKWFVVVNYYVLSLTHAHTHTHLRFGFYPISWQVTNVDWIFRGRDGRTVGHVPLVKSYLRQSNPGALVFLAIAVGVAWPLSNREQVQINPKRRVDHP